MNRWVEVDLAAIKNNLSLIKKTIDWPNVKLMPVIKANAYGHGLVEVGKLCEDEGADYLAIATIDEALTLRQAGIKTPILNIGYTDESEFEEAIKNDISISIYDIDLAKKLSKAAKSLGKKAKIHLKLDSGMHRLGLLPEGFIDSYKQLLAFQELEIEYIYTHFAEITNEDYSQKQLDVVLAVLRKLEEEKLPVPKVHMSRSESLIWPQTRFSMVRPGLATYGVGNIDGLAPALSFKTRIAQVKNIKAGDFVGYGLTYHAPSDSKIAVLAVGYADGYGRSLSNKGEVLVNGERCPVIGRVCMNLTIIDVSHIDKINIGDKVTLIGGEITAKELADKIGTIPYEILARIPSDISRVYKK